MRERGPLRKDVEEMLWETCYDRFESREISVDSLVADMAKLAVIEAEQTPTMPTKRSSQ
jgi:hypothetical protein